LHFDVPVREQQLAIASAVNYARIDQFAGVGMYRLDITPNPARQPRSPSGPTPHMAFKIAQRLAINTYYINSGVAKPMRAALSDEWITGSSEFFKQCWKRIKTCQHGENCLSFAA